MNKNKHEHILRNRSAPYSFLKRKVNAAGVLLFLFFVSSAPAQVLTHGPVVGGVTDTFANVFVRTSAATSVSLRYTTDPTFATYDETIDYQTDSSSDFTEIIPLSDLIAETPYYLDVVVNDVPQLGPPYPTFTTFPPAGSPRDFEFIVLTDFTTVTKLSELSQTFASANAEAPVFVFIGGDFDHTGPMTLTQKRDMFQNLYDPNTPFMSGFVPDILQRYPIAHQWDDHDAGLNNLDRTYASWPLTQQAFQEYVPTYPLPSVTPGIWQRFSYAQMDAFLLDCRSQRDPEDDPDDANKSMLDGNNLGPTGELQWLENGLLTSTAEWKVIFTSVVTNITTKFPDAWAGYQTEFSALREFINSNNILNVVFVAGDLHLAAIDDGSISGFPEMCVPMANGEETSYCATGSLGTWSEGYYNQTCSGYGRVIVQQNPDSLTLQDADQFGNTTLSYTVAAGQSPSPTPSVAPIIYTQPKSAKVNAGQSATFTVVATGSQPLLFQWLKNGSAITGATQSTYVYPNATLGDNGSLFSVTITNTGGTVTSAAAKLTVLSAPIITTQPANVTVAIGKKAKFSIVASGSSPLTYQWQENGSNIVGATRAKYVTPPTTATDNGSTFDCVVTNNVGSATSNAAILTTH